MSDVDGALWWKVNLAGSILVLLLFQMAEGWNIVASFVLFVLNGLYAWHGLAHSEDAAETAILWINS